MHPSLNEIKMKNTDLHTHSYYSDGSLSPKELVKLAKKRKIKNLALTDHNSTKGVEEAIKQGKQIGVNVIPGVEVKCRGAEFLGYFIDYKNKEFINHLNQISKQIEQRVKETCKNLEKSEYKITFKELQKKFPEAKGNLNEGHIFTLLYLKKYGPTMKIAKNIRKKKLWGKRRVKQTPIQAIKLIRKAGGIPVWAHPWLSPENYFDKIESFVKAGLKGIELNNGDVPPLRKKSMDKKIKTAAKKYDLILTSGSDYHGDILITQMPGDHHLGHTNCDQKIVEKLKKIKENQ